MSSNGFFTNLTKEGPQIPWAYVGLEGPQGSGKSVTGGLIALGLSVEFHNRAPVVWVDTEGGANFLQPMHAKEKVDLLWKPTSSLKMFRETIRHAKAIGACAIMGDSLTKFWRTTTRAFMEQKRITTMQQMLPHWAACKEPWFDMLDELKAAEMHKVVCGRGGFEWETIDVLNADGEVVGTEQTKGGHKMKAETETGHEPDLNLHMEAIKDPNAGTTTRQKIGKLIGLRQTGARKIHIATVEKGRTWALNGKIFQWPDRDSYEAGEYRFVLDCLRPYLATLRIGGKQYTAPADTGEPFREGTQEHQSLHRQKQIAIEEWDAIFAAMLPGQTAKEKNLRALIGREIAAGILSRTAFESQHLDALRFQVLVLNKLWQRTEGGLEFDLEKKDALREAIEDARKDAGRDWEILKAQKPDGQPQPVVETLDKEEPEAVPF